MSMEKQVKTSPKDFFLWVAAIAALYVSVVSMVTLLFQYIDKLLGDPLTYFYDPYSGAIRMAIASLIIIFPVYVWFTRMLNKDIRINPEKKDLWVRRWVLVLTLFIAGLTMVVDLIVLINAFLGGEALTAAFVLKVLKVLIVAGGAFMYYLKDIRGDWEKKEKQSVMIGYVVAALVLITIVSGFFIIGSPQEQRELRFDQEKVSGLQDIQYQVTNYWQQKGALPANLEALEDPLTGFSLPKDPQTNEGDQYVYKYRVVSNASRTFELCAVFNRESPAGVSTVNRYYYPGDAGGEYWKHDAGEKCFERTVDPDKFPPIKEALIR